MPLALSDRGGEEGVLEASTMVKSISPSSFLDRVGEEPPCGTTVEEPEEEWVDADPEAVVRARSSKAGSVFEVRWEDEAVRCSKLLRVTKMWAVQSARPFLLG